MGDIPSAYDFGEMGWRPPPAVTPPGRGDARTFAASNHFLGNPNYVEIPCKRLLSDEYGDRLRASISETATPSNAISPETGRDSQPTMHTTHFSIVDDQGNAVSPPTTTNFLYGSKVTVSGAGFVLNNEMNDFTAKHGEPNAFGLV